MQTYDKPKINFIELRAEEGLAGGGSNSPTLESNKLIATNEQLFPNNLVDFWMVILRK